MSIVKRLWAIPLSNSSFRSWENKQASSNLNIHISNAIRSYYVHGSTISLTTMRRFPNSKIRQLNKTRLKIENYRQIKAGDRILGISERNQIEKIGIVLSNEITTDRRNSLSLKINWIQNKRLENIQNPFFDSRRGIQSVSFEQAKKLDLPDDFYDVKQMRRIYSAITTRRAKYASGPGVVRKKLTKKKKSSSVQLKNQLKADLGGKITLFFGTNRNKTNSKNINMTFGKTIDKLRFGFCQVSIPKEHIQGVMERPKSFLFLKFEEKEGKHIVLKTLNISSEKKFIQKITNGLDKAPNKSAIVFIHGYNTTFSEAARRTAQIAWDIPFDGIAGFYSWPSTGKLFDYFRDEETVEASISDFEIFIEKIISISKLEKLHLIAHSMGNRLLSFSLNDLQNKASLTVKLKKINQIILGAADIDQKVFQQTILPVFQNIGNQRTLYSSKNDSALHLSKKIRRGLPRLGDAGKELFVKTGIDTIDASNVNSGKTGHSYIFTTKEVLTDLFFLLKKELKPSDRRLKAEIKNNLPYWLFMK